jgi:hypothetical protein
MLFSTPMLPTTGEMARDGRSEQGQDAQNLFEGL